MRSPSARTWIPVNLNLLIGALKNPSIGFAGRAGGKYGAVWSADGPRRRPDLFLVWAPPFRVYGYGLLLEDVDCGEHPMGEFKVSVEADHAVAFFR